MGNAHKWNWEKMLQTSPSILVALKVSFLGEVFEEKFDAHVDVVMKYGIIKFWKFRASTSVKHQNFKGFEQWCFDTQNPHTT